MTREPVDREYWRRQHPHPLAPNADDVETYRGLIADATTVLLLGNTPALMPLCTMALDLDPFDDSPRSKRGDWLANLETSDAIIGDGVMNFTKPVADGVLKMAAKTTQRLVARSFTRRLPIMRVADYFPAASDFAIPPTRVHGFDDYQFFVWDFGK